MKGALVVALVVLLGLTISPASTQTEVDYLEWITLSDDAVVLPESDDGTTGPINIATPGFPFWDSVQTEVYVGTNGLISFGSRYNSFFNQRFPGSGSINFRYLVAPFWDDVDIRGGNGEISYHIFNTEQEMNPVNDFIQRQTNFTSFEGTWMMVVFWDRVHPYFGNSNPEENTFQAVLITDGVDSFTVFTYNCGLIEWDNGATIGFNAAGQEYNNQDLSGMELACINGNASDWSSVLYTLSMVTNIPMEEAQQYTLDFINITNPDDTLDSCENPECSGNIINFPTGFPFGGYTHSQAYINDNGVISMPSMFPTTDPSDFPTTTPESYWLHSVAPFWSNGDLREEGSVKWKIYQRSDMDFSPVDIVVGEYLNASYIGSWMLVVHWDGIHPYPHGDDQSAAFNQRTNSFQAILTTDGNSSYAVFTYKCSSMEWAVQPTVGTNAGGSTYNNHPLNGKNYAFKIGCVHTGLPNDTNNIVYSLVPNPNDVMPLQAQAPYHNTIGSCVAANYTSCCTSGSCLGEPQSCYCDALCREDGTCCYDQVEICPLDLLTDDYLIVAEDESLDHIAYNGSGFQQIRSLFNGDAVGIDFHLQNNYVFWSDVSADVIYRASIDGTGVLYTVVDRYISAVDDIAVDWVANNIYWVDAIWARIEVADVNGMYRKELISVGANTNPRSITVDPERRYMFWTDWGQSPKIERADMDGENRQTIIGDNLLQPFGITVDYDGLKIYWCDSGFDIIEYASLDGDERTVLIQDAVGLQGVFALTVASSRVFWTDTETEAVYSTHKIDGNVFGANSTVVYDSFRYSPAGIEAVSSSRQQDVFNTCENSGCEELCVLSTNFSGFTCLSADVMPPVTPDTGSCADAAYSECCTHGYCAGLPPTCFCDENCYDRGDCCNDVNIICFAVPPQTPLEVTVSNVTATSAIISWTIPEVVYTAEEYYVQYGQDTILDQTSASQSNVSGLTNQMYSIMLQNLHPDYIYNFVVTAENSVSPKSTDIFTFRTLEAAPSGPPQNVVLVVSDNTVLTVSWEAPADDMQNGVITSYSLVCTGSDATAFSFSAASPQNISFGVFIPQTVYTCTIYASTAVGPGPSATSNIAVPEFVGTQFYLPFIPLRDLNSPNITQLPESDDGVSGPIPLAPTGMPFGDSNQTTAFVGTNGLLSFGTQYNSFFNRQFSQTDSLYLVAPFWDDVDIRGGNGEIFYQTVDSGPFLAQVNDYIKIVRPTSFEATWMMVAHWVEVHPYFGASNPEENTFQAILATDGTSTYAIFTYKCGLLEWGGAATIGFTAAGNPFINNDPSSSDVACVNSPDSEWSNIVYLLSNNNPEDPPPTNVMITNVTNNSVTVEWTIPYVTEQQQYTVLYGYSADLINITGAEITGSPNTSLTNQTYSVEIAGLDRATTYLVQVISEFGIYTLYSDIMEFTTMERAPYGPPTNFNGTTEGLSITFTWEPPVGGLLIDSYTLTCVANEDPLPIQIQLNPIVTFTLGELVPSTTYTCTLSATTTGGAGPTSPPISLTTTDATVTDVYFPFIQLNAIYGVNQVFVPESNDGTTGPIPIETDFPFGSSVQTQFYVGTNGLLSFDTPYNSFANQQFPGSFTRYLVAPFWDDVDIRGGNGEISYEIHTSGYYLDEVNAFLQRKRPSDFVGTWMAVVYYDAIHPYFGASNPEENTYQVILVTDGTYSYTIFTYLCGLMEWDNGATIGFSAAGDPYANHDPSTADVACLNFPQSNLSNVIFRLSDSNPELEVPDIIGEITVTRDLATIGFVVPRIITQETYIIEYGSEPNMFDQSSSPLQSTDNTSAVNMTYTITIDGLSPATIYYYRVLATFDVVYSRYSEVSLFRTKENEQAYYLEFLPHDDSSISSGTLSPCDDCVSEEILLPDTFPFGGYFHQSAFVSTNGLMSFGRNFSESTPEIFPSTTVDIFWRYIVAPFWADFNSVMNGSVSYEIYTRQNSSDLLNNVDQLIRMEYGDSTFAGEWMLVAYWEDIQSPFASDMLNTFQAILTTNGSKSYSVFTYHCGDLQWLNDATIGFNAPPENYENHPLTGSNLYPDAIACVHVDSEWNNVIYDLEPSPLILAVTPEPFDRIGSCRDAGYSTCCRGAGCQGFPSDCYCDTICVTFNDCCYDFEDICPDASSNEYDLFVANGQYIHSVHFQGSDNDIVRFSEDEQNIGIDVYIEMSKIFWSDVANDVIYCANSSGSDPQIIVDENIDVVEDLAVDWVSNKLYWVDAVWARIEAMDLVTFYRTEVLRTGAHTTPRAIAVEPLNRIMFWTDWGQTAKIERSFMNGDDRRTIISSSLSQPNGITVDYISERIYWTDSELGKIEYANYDGTGRTSVETGTTATLYPFALTIADNILFWSDWATGSVYATHKDHGVNGDQGYFSEIVHFPASIPYGIEAFNSSRQPYGINSCEMNNCSHVCLMTFETEQGYTCACPDGYALEPDGFECKALEGSGSGIIPPPEGSCIDGGYNETCCVSGYCAGYPATCFCDVLCYDRGDCCSDIDDICERVRPVVPTDVMTLTVTGTSAIIVWTVPYIELSSELYTVEYGLNEDSLDQFSSSIPSYSDLTLENHTYTVILSDLRPLSTYYYRIRSENSESSSLTEVMQFTTAEGAPSGPPLNFSVWVEDTSLACSWDMPADDKQNGVIVSYNLVCTAGGESVIDVTLNPNVFDIYLDLYSLMTTYSCTVAASTAAGMGPPSEAMIVTTESTFPGVIVLPFIPPGILLDQNVVYLAEADDGVSDAIILDISFPFGSSNRSSIYVGTNGLLSFDTPYNTWFTSVFPGSVSFRYLVAPFWDDADTRGGSGQVYFEIHQTGHFLDQVNSYISTVRPSRFEGTWMLVSYWDAIHPYPGSFRSEENTFQTILITDGTYTYAVFTYLCGLLEWGSSPTIGYNAAGEHFDNYDPSSVDIACLNAPLFSNWSNVVYLLSTASPEFAKPEQVVVSTITPNSAVVSWIIPSLTEQQMYYVQYGNSPDALTLTTDPITSGSLLPNQTYSATITGLDEATDYYIQVVATFSDVFIYSSTESFRTIEPPPSGPPQSFSVSVVGVSLMFSWARPADVSRIEYYDLTCSVDGEEALRVTLQPVLELTLDELMPLTEYTCAIQAATSGGSGPLSEGISVVTGASQYSYLPFIPLSVTYGVGTLVLPESDDGVEGPITISTGFPFGSSVQREFYIGTNGLLSFDESYNTFFNQEFPGSGSFASRYLVAPFWDDVDIRGGNGVISYEIHENGYFLDSVNNFLQRVRPSAFVGTWMAVVSYDAVHPYFGANSPEENTFQVILITDGDFTYTIFVYKCGLLEWDNGVIIGFSAASDPYDNNDPSSSDIACLNYPDSNYTNVVYRLSNNNSEIPPPEDVTYSTVVLTSASISWRLSSFMFQEQYYVEFGTDPNNLNQMTAPIQSPSDTTVTNRDYSTTLMGLQPGTIYFFRVVAVYDEVYRRYSEVGLLRTKEEEQLLYLPFFEPTDTYVASGTLDSCDDCSSLEITLPDNFAFGGYFHQSIYVGSNGLISFGRPVTTPNSESFPSEAPEIFWSYIAAPFWSDVNTTVNGTVWWEIHGVDTSASMLSQVSNLIRSQYDESTFSGTWMIVATWKDVVSPSLTMGNTFQAILITDGLQSYAVFTYRCGYLDWSTPATIGINAPPEYYYNHPLTGTVIAPDEIACVHVNSVWNNVIIDMEPNPLVLPVTPEPSFFIGSCVAAGYNDCCIFDFFSENCFATDCYCDDTCLIFDDCCYDFTDICPDPSSPEYDLVVGNGDDLFLVHYEGANAESLRFNESQTVQGIDLHINQNKIFWSHSENFTSSIHQTSVDDPTQEMVLVDTNLLVVVDLAVDWIANNLYWVDSAWARIEVLSLDTMYRAEILRTGANTNPTAIAVDPVSRFMFWTDFGVTAQIERAFLDGSERRVIHNTDLLQPVGITIDYSAQRIYWSDVGMDRIEFSSFDGSGRRVVETEATGLYHPFGLTVADDLLFWSDWETNSVYVTHKEHGADETVGYFSTVASFTSTPYGLEAALESKQSQVYNPCEAANCSHICLQTGFNEQEFSCTCPEGYRLEPDGLLCKVTDGSGTAPPPIGSCSLAGYTTCCTHGYCAGSPATCFCNPDCAALGSCCSDFDIICQETPPLTPTYMIAVNVNRTTADITWVVPRLSYGTETYIVEYGMNPENLDMKTEIVFSGLDTSLINQLFSVTLKNLQPQTMYYYRVVATNIINSTSSDVEMFSTVNFGPPVNFEVVVTGTESLTFSWDAPYGTAELDILSYTLFCHPRFQDEISIVVPTPGTITLEDEFLPGTTYTCCVYGTNADGDGLRAVQTATTREGEGYLPFLVLGNTPDVERIYLPYEDDAASDPIELIGGLPIGDTIHTRAYVGTNGFISLDQSLFFWDAAPFPTSEYYIINSYMFAPFWSDIDIGTSGSVSYEMYFRGTSVSEDAVLDRVSGYIATESSSGFFGYWMMVAQWDAVHPFPHSLGSTGLSDDYIEYLQKENTFQSIIITNGTMTYAVYTYNCDLMGWSGYDTYATIGYNLNGDYENHFLSGLESANSVACLSSPTTKWSNLVYAVDMTGVTEEQMQRSLCITRVLEDQDIFGDLDDVFVELESCPCSLGQAQVDPRFALYFSSEEFDCYVQLIPFGTAVQGCCYSTVNATNGALLTSGPNRGSMLVYSPFLYLNETLQYDNSLRLQCCEEVGLCDLYFIRRLSHDCLLYEPLTWAWGFGDPHFRNLDRTTFTFNGQGEYIMVEVAESGFVLQGRTEPVTSDQNQATRFTAFAFGLPSVDIVVEVRVERGRMIIYYNREDVSLNLLSNSIVMDQVALTLVDTNTVSIVFSMNDITHSVWVTLDTSVEYLSYALNLANSPPIITSGLLGTLNGDTSDDFMYPDGTSISFSASDELIHDWGQAWQITAQESLFFYGPGLSASNYSNPDFNPDFKSDIVADAPDMISTYCGENAECIFDYAVSGSEDVAQSTLLANENYLSKETKASTFPPRIYGDGYFEVTIGQPSSYNMTVLDGQLEVLGELPADSILVEDSDTSGLYIFTWTLSSPTDTPITFIASNSNGGLAVHSPRINICACANGGVCTEDGFLGTNNNIVLLQCFCPEAWGGQFCDEDLNGCSQIHCFQDIQCLDVPVPGSGHVCGPCSSGFIQELEKCADIDECSRQDTNDCQQSCINTFGSYECTCIMGYEPDPENPTTCIDVNECEERTDGCEQMCSNTEGSFLCSCLPGFTLNSDRRTCDQQTGTDCPDTNECSNICTLIDGIQVCSCPRGYLLGSDDRTCEDVNECSDSMPCEQICNNTLGSFVCSCGTGYTMNDDGRSCNDVDECNTPVCPDGQICENTAGSFMCVCPEGTMLNDQGECENIPVVEPTKMVVLPSVSSTVLVVIPTPTVGGNSLLVTIPGYNTETFDVEQFRKVAAEILTECCTKDQCQKVDVKREVGDIKADNVIITDIKNASNGRVQFTMYVVTNDGNILKPDSVESCLKSGEDMLEAAGFSAITYESNVNTDDEGGSGGGGLSGGAVAGIVIAVLFVVVAVGAATAFILFRMKRRGKYTISFPHRMSEMLSSEKKDLSALMMSTEEEGEL